MNQSPKKRSEPAKKIGGGSLPLATASSPMATASSATPSNGGHPRNAPEEISLMDAVSFIVDNRGKTAPVEDSGITLIATNCISNDNLYPQKINVRYVSQSTYNNWFRAHPKPGDIILTNKGSQNGAICLVPDPVDFCIAQDMVALRANTGIVDPLYLFAVLRSEQIQKRIKELNVDSVIPHFKKTDFDKLKLPLLPLKNQRLVGKFYHIMSQKIEANRRINQTLEAMAQALFQSWFVDFDPVKAKQKILEAGGTAREAELAAMQIISGKNPYQLKTFQQTQPQQYAELEHTAKLFPNRLVESELGLVPEGWEWKNFGAVAICFDSKRIPLSKVEREKMPGHIPYYGATSVMDSVGEFIFDGTYLLIGEDGSVLKEDGSPFVQYVWGKSWVNNHAHVLQGAGSVSTEHLMVFAKSQNITPYVNGAVQMKLNQKNMNSIPFLFASEKINAQFARFLSSVYSAFRKHSGEIGQLEVARDSLLPKLLSGEIDVSSINGGTNS